MIDVIRKVIALLSPKERRQAYMLLGMILVMATLDVVGIASIMPFMAVLANPDVVQSNPHIKAAYDALGFNNTQTFLFVLGTVVFGALLVSISFKAATTWAITHFSQMRNYSIARRLVSGYLRQPYEWFLSRHSSDIGTTVLSEVQLVVQGALMPLMNFLAQGTVVFAILLMLIVVDPYLALIVGTGMGGSYGVIYLVLRRLLNRVGKERVAANEMRFKVLSEAFGGFKEVKLGALEEATLERFDFPALRFARTQVTAQVAGQLPRFALEIIAFGGMLLLVLFLMRRTENFQSVLPIIALYALAGYRLMPALQMVYQKATALRFSVEALGRIHADLQELEKDFRPSQHPESGGDFESAIRLENVSYTYPNADRPAVERLSLEIPARSTVGFVGSTGSGKTTTVDIILGLLEPHSGSLYVGADEIESSNRRAWQRTLGYVPQHIFLLDESVAQNIAFGVPHEMIDNLAVERAARIANIHDFVTEQLPEGYDTQVGERGVRLSGGQRQRIGIARALYHRPQVLVLDEATSALDNLTEQAVIDAVHNLSGEITIIIIAHRLTTVRECERIYVLEHGRLVGEGTYAELNANDERFRAMAKA